MTDTGPNLELGISPEDLSDGAMLMGRVGDRDVLVARRGEEVFAIDGLCPHYHAPLAAGLLVGDTVRCPLHHACFSLRTGAALRAPALDSVACWRVERSADRIIVRERLKTAARPAPIAGTPSPRSIVVLGGGVAGVAAAVALREEGYEHELTLLSADDSAPYDRPNLSKDFLDGTAPDAWMPLRTPKYYVRHDINLMLNATASVIDVGRREVTLQDGRILPYDGLVLATGADAIRLPIPGAAPETVRYLRTFTDARALVAQLTSARTAIVAGASFIGLEVAASLRKRGLAVHVVAPDAVPMARVLGPEVGRYIQGLHQAHGVTFHLGTTIAAAAGGSFTLADGQQVEADLVVAGVGVRPAVQLAQRAGLAVEDGVMVDEYLQTSAAGVYAAGDLARWPDPHSGERLRVEHYVLAQRQGQTAARNLLGRREKFDAVPFFWSQHYDITLRYVGHARTWDALSIEGSLAQGDCTIRYERAGRTLAVATIGRDRQNLEAEVALESAPPS
ncbi:MAG TPA: FAD-dependent oxidoreductase [Steroidobacteraceae bacterium]|nr:FAD-dependent oxidoreductase [Steroidobacteraceae bacterium]